jgi:hypothetical protein
MCDCAWRPISTAPKDGTVIVVWNPQQPETARFVRWGMSAIYKSEGWVTRKGNIMAWQPTHWMPVEPPQ